jgi:hypothetical protein
MNLVEQTCEVGLNGIIFGTKCEVDFTGHVGTKCGKPFFGYVGGTVPACREHCQEFETILGTIRP